MAKKLELAGKRFGMLTAEHEVAQDDKGACVWHCRCDCGRTKDVTAYSLNSGRVTSCGQHRALTQKVRRMAAKAAAARDVTVTVGGTTLTIRVD